MSIQGEIAYSEGYIDGQIDVLEEILDIVDKSDDRTEAFENIMEFVKDKKREIDSL